jgi:hypothetical protein
MTKADVRQENQMIYMIHMGGQAGYRGVKGRFFAVSGRPRGTVPTQGHGTLEGVVTPAHPMSSHSPWAGWLPAVRDSSAPSRRSQGESATRTSRRLPPDGSRDRRGIRPVASRRFPSPRCPGAGKPWLRTSSASGAREAKVGETLPRPPPLRFRCSPLAGGTIRGQAATGRGSDVPRRARTPTARSASPPTSSRWPRSQGPLPVA